MPVGLNIIKPFNHQRHDQDQPNFIFSSDIPEKVNKVVRRYIHREDDNENIGSNIDFKINIELNILLTRNKDLRPSDLIKDNLICVAKTNGDSVQNRSNLVLPYNDNCLNIFKNISNGLFIINLTLKTLEFVVNKVSNSVFVEFLKDESYGILLLSDEQFVIQITNYIKGMFVSELNKLSENLLTMPEEVIELNTEEFSSIAKDVTLEDSTINVDSSFVDKSFTYEDDYESSLEELILLKSNDTIRSNEEELSLDDILPETLKKSDNRASDNKRFLKELDNLRHNETSSETGVDEEMNGPCIDLMDDAKKSFNEDNKEYEYYEDKSIPIDDYIMSPQKSREATSNRIDSIQNMTSHSSVSSLSSQKENVSARPSLGSFSMVNHEDNHGLEYAFKINTSSVPSYIKEDKKFKFIKIGKVQKFVNLFEEKLVDPTKSSTSSRSPSPFKTPK